MQRAESLRLHRWADGRRERLAPLLWLAVMTGMRRGEPCALSWVDVDLERAVLTVRSNAVAWHSLRHRSASIHLAASAGDVFSVSRRLGHTNVTTTSTIYGHEIESIQHAQTEAAARALQGHSASGS